MSGQIPFPWWGKDPREKGEGPVACEKEWDPATGTVTSKHEDGCSCVEEDNRQWDRILEELDREKD